MTRTMSAMWIQDIHCRPSPIVAGQAELRRQREPLKDAAIASQHQADAQVHDADALGFRGIGRRFPLQAQADWNTSCGGRRFRQPLVAARAVEADGAGA